MLDLHCECIFGAVIRWKKQGGLANSVVDHCGGPCCVGKSFLNPSNWTWESDRLRSDHRGGCVQWIVVMNRAVKLTGSTADVNHWSHQCELEMVQHYPICGRQESLTRFRTSHKLRALGSLNKVLWGEALAVNPRGITIFVYKRRQARVGDPQALRLVSSQIGIWVDWCK